LVWLELNGGGDHFFKIYRGFLGATSQKTKKQKPSTTDQLTQIHVSKTHFLTIVIN